MNSSGNTKVIAIPKKSEKLAEFVGIVLGDGNIDAYKKGKKIRTYAVRIAGHAIDDYEYMKDYVAPLASSLFQVRSSIHFHRTNKGMYVSIYGKRIVEFFNKMGIKSGNKIRNKTKIPGWILKEKKYIRACLRGLYDTDGSIYELLPHWPGLYQLNFDNYNLIMLKQVRFLLIKIGYHPSKIHGNKTKNGTKVDLTRKAEIKKFYKEIGTHNKKHKDRFLGIAPSKGLSLEKPCGI